MMMTLLWSPLPQEPGVKAVMETDGSTLSMGRMMHRFWGIVMPINHGRCHIGHTTDARFDK